MLEQELAAIIRFCRDEYPVQAYWDEVPKGFKIPSIFFPKPMVVVAPETVNSYRNVYTMFVKVFAKSSKEAFEIAEKMQTKLWYMKKRVPTYSEQNVLTGESLRLDETSISRLDVGVYQISMSWHSNYPFYKETVSKIQSFFIKYIDKSRGGAI